MFIVRIDGDRISLTWIILRAITHNKPFAKAAACEPRGGGQGASTVLGSMVVTDRVLSENSTNVFV